MSYARIQAIRESAGLLSRSTNEKPIGAVDGANKEFVSVRRPIVDSDYDDKVTEDDVRVYFNGIPVEVDEVDAGSGKITTVVAPAIGVKVAIDYCFSPITDEYTGGKQEEADSWIDLKLRPLVSSSLIPRLPLNPIPGTIVTIAELYAAGLILTRDFGNRVDTSQSSKDGKAKIDLARQLLSDFIDGVKSENASSNANGAGTATSVSDGDVFDRVYREGCDDIDRETDEEYFMRRR